MSDGEGNSSGTVSFNFVPGQRSIRVRDARNCFGVVSRSCPSGRIYLDEAAAYLFEDSSGNQVDVLTRLDGTQPIRTYTIGFQAPTNAEALMEAMAERGDGRSYSVTTYEQLTTAFEEIISNIVGRSRVSFNPGAAQVESFFTDNFIYVSDFRPTESGHWLGNTKKLCIIPSSSSDTSCMFRGSPDDQDNLRVNPNPQDMWSGSVNTSANSGGAGEVMLQSIFGVQHTGVSPPSNPLGRRTILTWRPGTHGYVSVDGTSLTTQDTWSNTTCLHYSLLNSIHGYRQSVLNCDAQDYSPTAFDSWPIGDTSNAGNVVLKYSEHCEDSTDSCFGCDGLQRWNVAFLQCSNGL